LVAIFAHQGQRGFLEHRAEKWEPGLIFDQLRFPQQAMRQHN